MAKSNRLVVFETNLGWCGIAQHDEVIERISIGHTTRYSLLNRKEFDGYRKSKANLFERELTDLFKAHACGEQVDFDKYQLDTSLMTPFESRVSQCCRQIPYGTVFTYGELATQAGSPRAFRAVGTVMSKNPFPIIVPCHRVVAAGKKIGGFSSPQGISTKLKLLDIEGVELAGSKRPSKKYVSRKPQRKKKALASC